MGYFAAPQNGRQVALARCSADFARVKDPNSGGQAVTTILFLDVDGVLHPCGTPATARGYVRYPLER